VKYFYYHDGKRIRFVYAPNSYQAHKKRSKIAKNKNVSFVSPILDTKKIQKNNFELLLRIENFLKIKDKVKIWL
jgi:translation initiation factor IF-3